MQQILEFHDRFWASPFSVPVSSSMRETYGLLQRRQLNAQLALRREPQYERARLHLDLAVAEAIASYGEPRGSATWLMITSPENYILCERGRIWGDERRNRISLIHEGDLLLFYISGLHQLGMMALVTGSVFEEDKPFWEDRRYPFRLPFQPLATPRAALAFKPLVPRLAMFEGVDARNWGQVLQRAQIKLGSEDARLVRQTILEAAGLEGAA